MKKNGHDIFITNDQKKIEYTKELRYLIVNAVAAALKYEKFDTRAEVSVTLCDNERIRQLNKEYRNIDRPTDVLSFPLFDDEDDIEEESMPLGDIVISLEKAKEQSELYGHSFEREVGFICVHSVLHLLGSDHEEGEAEKSEMFAKQSEILSLIGLER